jgi:hypothetical protein
MKIATEPEFIPIAVNPDIFNRESSLPFIQMDPHLKPVG